ncbi:hypothetical protein GCM10027521_09960 [Amycolatopsis cihanbeyliensis]
MDPAQGPSSSGHDQVAQLDAVARGVQRPDSAVRPMNTGPTTCMDTKVQPSLSRPGAPPTQLHSGDNGGLDLDEMVV